MAITPIERNSSDALRRLLGLNSPTNIGGMSDAGLETTADPRLAEFEPTEQDLMDAQLAQIDQQRAAQKATPNVGTIVPSRESLKSQAMGKVRQLLGLGDIEQQRKLEMERLKEEGLVKRAELSAKREAEARPYFTPLQTAEGIQSFDTRTGKISGRLGDFKPAASAEEALTNAQGVQADIQRVRQYFRPEFVGPLAGRYGSVEQALLGGNPAMTDLYQTAQRLHNTIVYLRTGKQMNESEASRILAEIPQKNDKPDVFIAKLNNMGNYFDEWFRNRSQFAFGRHTTEDVNRMTGAPPVQSAAPTGSPQAAPRVRRYNPATGRIE